MNDEWIWMTLPGGITPPCLVVFRNEFFLAGTETVLRDFYYSADERAILFLDGERIGDGPERGSDRRWYYAVQPLRLTPGRHVLTARLNAFGSDYAQRAQLSLKHGFAVRRGQDFLSEKWSVKCCEGLSFRHPQPDWGTAPRVELSPEYDEAILSGEGGSWQNARIFEDRRRLFPPELPPMRFEPVTDYHFDGQSVRFDRYLCCWAAYEFTGPGTVELQWHEDLRETAGRTNCGTPADYIDRFTVPAGGLRWFDFWWRCGRRIDFRFTGKCGIRKMEFFRTGYPFSCKVDFHSADPRVDRLLKLSRNTLENCAFETYMDCPFYEQLQYVADSRIECLATRCVTDDCRLPRKAIRMLADSQREDGAIMCRYPGRDDRNVFQPSPKVSQFIPGFHAIYLQMVHDFALRRVDDALVKSLLPVLRRAARFLAGYLDGGILRNLPGWNFLDWHPRWHNGIPPFCVNGCGCTLNFLAIQSFRDLADLELFFGSREESAAWNRLAKQLEEATLRTFYDTARQGFAEDEGHRYFSEHAQVAALLFANRREVIPLLRSGTLDQCGIYFSFYYLDACRRNRLDDCFERRRAAYLELAARPELDTLPEEFHSWRSYCHAWSGHFLYFQYATPNEDYLNRLTTTKEDRKIFNSRNQRAAELLTIE